GKKLQRWKRRVCPWRRRTTGRAIRKRRELRAGEHGPRATNDVVSSSWSVVRSQRIMEHGLDSTTSTVLFLCTGNYYRSRFAEHYFNALAAAAGLAWRAVSRGLRLNPNNPGPISRQTVRWLGERGIVIADPSRFP